MKQIFLVCYIFGLSTLVNVAEAAAKKTHPVLDADYMAQLKEAFGKDPALMESFFAGITPDKSAAPAKKGPADAAASKPATAPAPAKASVLGSSKTAPITLPQVPAPVAVKAPVPATGTIRLQIPNEKFIGATDVGKNPHGHFAYPLSYTQLLKPTAEYDGATDFILLPHPRFERPVSLWGFNDQRLQVFAPLPEAWSAPALVLPLSSALDAVLSYSTKATDDKTVESFLKKQKLTASDLRLILPLNIYPTLIAEEMGYNNQDITSTKFTRDRMGIKATPPAVSKGADLAYSHNILFLNLAVSLRTPNEAILYNPTSSVMYVVQLQELEVKAASVEDYLVKTDKPQAPATASGKRR